MSGERRGRDLVSRYKWVGSLLTVLVRREVRVRYRRSILDIAWAVLTPAVVLAVYGVVLTQAFGVDGACAPYVTSAWTGLVMWTFFATAVGVSVTSLVSSSELVTKVYFPKEAVPLSVTGATLLDLAVGAVTIVVVMAVQGVRPAMTSFLVVLPFLMLIMWSAAISVIVSVLAVFARDLVHAVHLVIRVGFFATPVVYEASVVPAAFAWTAAYNPIGVSITATRDLVFCGTTTDIPLVLIHLGIAAALLVAGTLYTRSVESNLTDVV